MLTLQQMADIAARHETRVADAMLAACVRRAVRTGERLRPTARRRQPRARGGRTDEDEGIDWERWVRSNREVRALFVGTPGARARGARHG